MSRVLIVSGRGRGLSTPPSVVLVHELRPAGTMDRPTAALQARGGCLARASISC